ncbi:DUF6445 family protein [Paucibacter sp. R3-3]|uniref:DUF6445 family protein n=1 Tax=Roseateles agri TaxID=3098619 RepID=A0ABU5DKJ0_9BURK|nr:DUF6445 family protein [Paucibacter sp. R3-3]MDY0746205.1 DUF6445 family protein [Paucibacter sp. R3-3]
MKQQNRPRTPPVDTRAGDPQRLLDEGRRLHAQGRVQDAFARYQAALIAAPDDADAMQLLGLAYLGLGQGQVGIAFVRRAVERRPGSAEFRANLANAELQLGRPAEALAQMAQACLLQPADGRLRASLADMHLRLGANDEAERHLEAAVALDGTQAAWHETLAQLRYRRWALDEALASAERARALSPAIAPRLNIGWARASGPAPDAAAVAAQLRSLADSLDGAALIEASAARDLVVIDDFLPDPLAFRDEALRLCAAQAAAGGTAFDGNFPGVQTPALPSQPTMRHIAQALGRDVKWNSLDNGALRVSLAHDAARADVHVDNPTLTDIFGGVLYLSLPEHCQGGTRFYRHRASGWERRPALEELKAKSFASFLDFQKRSLPANRKMSFDEWLQRREATWEALFEIPMRFNRLILFRSDFFHSITELFGDRMENGRLVQLFHFEGRPSGG